MALQVEADAGVRVRAVDFRPDIQGLRAVAVLLVVAYHAGLPLSGGFIGVDVFFVISGYVITGMLQREWVRTGHIHFGAFYWRRFKRLAPALAVMVTVVVLLSVPLLSPFGVQQHVAETALGVITLSANAVIAASSEHYDALPAETNPLLNTWSLSVEEQLYLVFPAVLALSWWIAARARRWRFAPAAVVAIISAASFAGMWLHTSGHPSFDNLFFSFYSPLARAWEFGVGALIALTPRDAAMKVGVRMRGGVHALSMAMLLLCAVLVSNEQLFLGVPTLLPVACAALLLFIGAAPAGTTHRLLVTNPLVNVGDWSYSIYLWHWPLIVVARALWPTSGAAPVLAAAVSLIPAVISYRYIEDPIRRMHDIPRTRSTQLAFSSVMMPVVLASGLGVAANNGWWSLAVTPMMPPTLGSAEQQHIGEGTCLGDGVALTQKWSVATCTWNAAASGAPIYVVGDSNAWQFGEALSIASERLDRSVTERAGLACPFSYVVLANYGVRAECEQYMRDTVQWLRSAPRGTVVIAQSDYYWRDPQISAGPTEDAQSNATSDKLRAFESGLQTAARELRQAGHDVLLVETIPNFFAFGSDAWPGLQGRCNLLDALREGPMCRGISTSTQEVQQRQGASWAAVRRVADATGARTLNLMSTICPDGTCAAYRSGRWVYSDIDHITTSESAALAPVFERVLGQ